MKKYALFLLAGVIGGGGGNLLAQYQDVPSTNFPALEAILNAKPSVTMSNGAPVSSLCTAGKDIYLDLVAQDLYWCTAIGTWSKLQKSDSTLVKTGQANTYTAGQLQDFSGAKIKLAVSSVSTLPSAVSNTNVIYLVTDGTSASDCTVGGGSTRSLCASNGGAWVALGGSGGGGGSGTVNSGLGGQLAYYSSTGTAVSGMTMGGDCTLSAPNVTCTKTNGTNFATVATSGSASDLSAGTLNAARLPAFTGDMTTSAGSAATTVGKVNGATIPASQPCLGSNSSSQLVTGTCSGGGGGTANVPTASISGATATFFSACAIAGCNVSEGGTQVQNFTAANTATAPASGTGSLYVFWNGTSGCQAVLSGAGSAVTFAGSGPCSGVTSTSGTGFPNTATAIISRVDYGSAGWTGFVNYQPAASTPPVYAAGTGLIANSSPSTTTFLFDTSAASLGIGTANFVPKWTGNNYTLGPSLTQDNGTNLGFNCAPGTTPIATFCSNSSSATPRALAISNNNTAGHIEYQLDNDGGLMGGFGVGGSTAADHANGIYIYNNTGSFDGWMNTGWTFRTGSFPGTLRLTIPTTGGVQYPTQTLSTLGLCTSGRDGTVARVSDLTSISTWGATVTGGGTNAGMVVCNGASTSWTLMGK